MQLGIIINGSCRHKLNMERVRIEVERSSYREGGREEEKIKEREAYLAR